MNDDCLFCRILAREAPGSFVYEDDIAVAFLDLFPVTPGHTLIVPRAHVADLLECSGAVAGHLFRLSATLAPAVLAAAGFNVWTANGAVAGQEIFHLHLHLLPRHDDDAFGLRFPKNYPQEAPRDRLNTMAAQIRSRMGTE